MDRLPRKVVGLALLEMLKARLDCSHWAHFRHSESLFSKGEWTK